MASLRDRICSEMQASIGKNMLTKNDAYKAGKFIVPKGIMTHSTGANNKKLSRYLPGDNLIGFNKSNNHWDMPKVGACVHGFIGIDKSNNVQVYQAMPWNMRAWHGGSGKNGSVNNTHISYEICEDNLQDKVYFDTVYEMAKRLNVYLAKIYNIPTTNMICHSEGARLGLASAHADVMHWWPKHGKSMDTFRAEIKAIIEGTEYMWLVQQVGTKIGLTGIDYWVRVLDGSMEANHNNIKALFDKYHTTTGSSLLDKLGSKDYWVKVQEGREIADPNNLVALFNKI